MIGREPGHSVAKPVVAAEAPPSTGPTTVVAAAAEVLDLVDRTEPSSDVEKVSAEAESAESME
jgi:hypothetical protein